MGLKHTNLWEFTCDNCAKKERFATAPETQRPIKWHRYTDEFTDYDKFGNALRNHTKRSLLCDDCAKLKVRGKSSSPQMIALAEKYLLMDQVEMLDREPEELVDDLRSLATTVLGNDPEASDPEEPIDG